ncbi:hypothetical protein [Lysobacter solisilvae (ex Woo and Kim 2020)]|uniref:Uncharacterized protein n=1 Tax=Agrilutibacter terrestris TaxID=2865112 RepID=A0A7H0FTX1_9GAMM|nr:hypothetical protein [Lysobacter terrestris]QNP39487.1 hypothetical protein H8B22_08035 [Lysobacter terrestris]
MSNVVQFLEALGASPNQISGANYASAVAAAKLDAAAHEALVARDQDGLNRAISGRAAMRCFVFVPD